MNIFTTQRAAEGYVARIEMLMHFSPKQLHHSGAVHYGCPTQAME